MRRSVSWTRLFTGAFGVLVAFILFSCARDGITGPEERALAKGGKPSGGGSPGGDVTVTTVDPDSAAQGVVNLVVIIRGSGFSRGAVADWERDGVPDPKVTVSATKLVSSTEVDATISIATDAELGAYSVAVTSGGKKGIGTEAFRVTLGDPTATWFIPVSDATLGFQGDAADTSFTLAGESGPTTYARYRDGECGVTTEIFSTTSMSGTGDAIISTDRGGRKSCSRSFTLDYQDGRAETLRSFNNLNDLENGLVRIPVGQTEPRRLILAPGSLASNPSRCGRVLFGFNDGPNGPAGLGSDSVSVTRLDGSTWLVRSQGGLTKAVCEATGDILNMPIRFVIEASRPLP